MTTANKHTRPAYITHEFTDEETGEVVRNHYTPADDKPPRKPRDKNFFRMRPFALKDLARLTLSASELRCLLWLISECSWANQVDIARAALQQELSLSRATVWKALTELENRKLLHFTNQERSKAWIDPRLCWRGHTEALPAAVRLFDQAVNLQDPAPAPAPPVLLDFVI
jgi:hypothetical protein